MKRPLIATVCYALSIAFLSYSPTTACDSGKKDADGVDTTVCVIAPIVKVHVGVSHDDAGTRVTNRFSTVKSSLRAGVAVGKVVGRTTVTLATTMARTAKHLVSEVLHAAYESA